METRTVYTPEMAWEATTDLPGAAEAKVLRDEGGRKARTMLVRLHAGGRATPHAHIGTVQHYVLEGEYESQGKIYGAGTYRLLQTNAKATKDASRHPLPLTQQP